MRIAQLPTPAQPITGRAIGRPTAALIVAALLILAPAPFARAAPLEDEACDQLKRELAQLERLGARTNMANGPDWAKANLAKDKIAQIKSLIEIDEAIAFRCPKPKPPPQKADAKPRNSKASSKTPNGKSSSAAKSGAAPAGAAARPRPKPAQSPPRRGEKSSSAQPPRTQPPRTQPAQTRAQAAPAKVTQQPAPPMPNPFPNAY